MTREIILSNGRMFVNFDSHLNMRDFYYPYVGMFNHLNGNANGIGVWVNDKFSWINDSWDIQFKYVKKTLISDITATNKELGIRLHIQDTIHKYMTVFLRKIKVINLNEEKKKIKIYFYHNFNLNESEIGNTAYYHPKLKGLIHYKGPTYFLITGCKHNGNCNIEYTVSKRTPHSGSWQEIETGHLSKTKIMQGEIDSAFGFVDELDHEETFYYCIVSGKTHEEIVQLKKKIDNDTIPHLIEETQSFWRAWIQEKDDIHPMISDKVKSLYYRSLLIVRSHIDKHGAILAANDTSIFKFNKDHYSYMWPRDGAFTSIALDKAGYGNLTKKFFWFCAEHITDEGFMLHKYSPDGTAGSSWHPWCDEEGNYQLPIQEDETALVVYALYEHYKINKDIEFVDSMYNRFVRPAANFLVNYRDEKTKLPLESYDLWEERRGIFSYTTATVYAGLIAASNLADLTGNHEEGFIYKTAAEEIKEAMLKYLYDEKEGRFLRMIKKDKNGNWMKDKTVESSLSIIFEMGILPADDERMVSTMKAIEESLWINTEIGGIARYEGDYYHRIDDSLPGNPWIITTLWLANWYIEVDNLEKAKELIDWVLKRRNQAGLLAEQYNPYTGEPLSVCPLTWSHSSFCFTVQKLNKKLRQEYSLKEKIF